MKISELRSKTSAELKLEFEASHRELFNLRMQRSANSGSGIRSHTIKPIRRKCARIKTILNERNRETTDE